MVREFAVYAWFAATGLAFGINVVDCTPGARSVAKTAFDVASEACRFAYGQKPSELPFGLTPEQFCGEVKNVQPFDDSILSAQRDQAEKLGTRRAPADAGAE